MDRAYIIAIMLNFTYFQRVSADCTRGLGRDGAELRILECEACHRLHEQSDSMMYPLSMGRSMLSARRFEMVARRSWSAFDDFVEFCTLI